MAMEFKKILEGNDTISEDILKNITILKVQYLKKSNILKVILKSKELLDEEKINVLRNAINKTFGCFDDIDNITYKDIYN